MQKEQEHTLNAIREYLTKNMPSGGKAILTYTDIENTKRKAKTCIREKYYLFLQTDFNIKWKRHNTSE